MSEPKKATKRAAKAAFSAEERAAMKDRAKETKAGRGNDASAVLEKIAELPEDERVLAERIHAIITENGPGLTPKLWYGMPAYYKDGKAMCFFQPAGKFKARYATLGFNDNATLDDGTMWPTAFAIARLTAADEARIADLIKRAAG